LGTIIFAAPQEINVFKFDQVYYFSVQEFCEANGYNYIKYDDKSKIEILFPKHRATFSLNSSFFKLDNNTTHMAQKVKYENDLFYLPINSFNSISSLLDIKKLKSNIDFSKLIIAEPSNILSYNISEVNSTVLFTIQTNTEFIRSDIFCVIIDENKFHISLGKGKIDNQFEENDILDNLLSVAFTQTENAALIDLNINRKINDYSYKIFQNKVEFNILLKQASYQLFSANLAQLDQSTINTIIIDAGHGGKDPGAIGYHNIKEKNIVLDIANELGKYIHSKMPNINIIFTRETDVFLGLKNRTNIANKNKGQLFISIHANSSSAKSARGYEIYLLKPSSIGEAIDVAIRENSSILFEDNVDQYESNQIIASLSQNTYLKESEKLAIYIQNGIKKELPKTRNRGIKQAGFHVLIGASMPNLLLEVGFVTNKSEAQLLNKSSYRKEFAKGIYNGIEQYVKNYEQTYLENRSGP
jgi:N-acetylmuramoyl-L-alanine amidase